jgi:hypothetical protein
MRYILAVSDASPAITHTAYAHFDALRCFAT